MGTSKSNLFYLKCDPSVVDNGREVVKYGYGGIVGFPIPIVSLFVGSLVSSG